MVGRDGEVGGLQCLNGKVSPNRIVVLVPGRAAVMEADQFTEIVQADPQRRSAFLSHEQFRPRRGAAIGSLQCRSHRRAENVPVDTAHERPDRIEGSSYSRVACNHDCGKAHQCDWSCNCAAKARGDQIQPRSYPDRGHRAPEAIKLRML